MQLIKAKGPIGNLAFYIGIGIHLLLMTIGYGEWSIPLHGRFIQVAFVLFCIKIVTTYYTKSQWVAMFLLGSLGVISYMGTRDEYIVSIIIMIFAAKNIDMRQVCRWIVIIALVFTIGTAVLSLCGIGGVPVDIRDYGRGGVEARWCLGFGHANNIHGTLWYLIALTIYLFFEKLDWRHYLLLTVCNILLFYFTVSKGGFIAAQIVIIAAVLLCYVKPLVKMGWIYILGGMGIIAVAVISFVSVCIDSSKFAFLMKLNGWFTGRISLAYQHAHISMWKLLSSAGEFGDTVDNGFVTIFFSYGYVVGAAFILFQLYLIYKAWREKEGVLLAIVVTCAFYTFMEASYTMNSSYYLCNLSYLCAMIFMAKSKNDRLCTTK